MSGSSGHISSALGQGGEIRRLSGTAQLVHTLLPTVALRGTWSALVKNPTHPMIA